jgi:hypothetical protein
MPLWGTHRSSRAVSVSAGISRQSRKRRKVDAFLLGICLERADGVAIGPEARSGGKPATAKTPQRRELRKGVKPMKAESPQRLPRKKRRFRRLAASEAKRRGLGREKPEKQRGCCKAFQTGSRGVFTQAGG